VIKRPDHVQVTSTREKIVGRYDGEDFEFLPGIPNSISALAAAHIFGFGKDDKTPALARLGWATSSDQNAQALERLRAVRFAEAPPLVEYEPEEEAAEASAGELMPDRNSGSRPIAPGGNAAPATQGAGAVEPPAGKKHGK